MTNKINSKQKGKQRDRFGRFTRNKNEWMIQKRSGEDNLYYCYLDDELLFFTDDADVMNYSWAKLANGYAATKIGDNIIAAHRFISKPNSDELVDHINRNKKDNRKENLRNTTKQINAYNSKVPTTNKSGVKGVRFREDTKRWQARIVVNQKDIYLGCFATKAEAIAARQAAERFFYVDK